MMRAGLAGMVCVVGLALQSGPVLAQNTGSAGTGRRMADACACRAAGALWPLGATACLGGRVHVCAMQQNVLSWQDTGRACPSASRRSRLRHAAPALLSGKG
ncbi:MAG: hypothetical protein ACRCXM_15845 [Beijerinckiaceae bacterium]